MKTKTTVAVCTTLALSTTAAQAATVFDADFDSATPGEAATEAAWKTLLDSGTQTGDWTVDNLSGTSNDPGIFTDAGATGPQAALFRLAEFDYTANLGSATDLSPGIALSFDIATVKGHNTDNTRRTQIIGIDSNGVEIFRLQATQFNGPNANSPAPSLDYYDATDTLVSSLASGGAIVKNDSTTYNPGVMTSVNVSLDGTGFDLTVGGNSIVSDVAYLNGGGAGDLAEIRFLGNNRGSIWLDNLLVEAVPEPGSMALLGIGGTLILRRRRCN